MYDVVIIGGGPAGLFSAIFSGERGLKVLILEKNNKLGKKLLIAGSGKCNLTHSGNQKEFLEKYGKNGKFLKPALYNFSSQDMIKFFFERGLKLVENENGKYFPNTMSSKDVLSLLLKECKKYNVEIRTEEEVIKVEKNEIFLIKSLNNSYESKNVIITTGGQSYPKTGSDGAGYKFSKIFGHSLEELQPSLTPVYVKEYCFSDLSGISFYNIPMMIKRDNKKIYEKSGDLLFTHKNLSGPLILDNSRYLKKNDIVSFNFVNKSYEEFGKNLIELIDKNGNKSIKNTLIEYSIPERFIKKILKLQNIEDDKKSAQLTKVERNSLIKSLVEYEFEVSRLGSYEVAMATKGGIALNEINNKTMESKLLKGLYFAGEVIDIDGDTGGYNIQAACSMGVLAAKSLSN